MVPGCSHRRKRDCISFALAALSGRHGNGIASLCSQKWRFYDPRKAVEGLSLRHNPRGHPPRYQDPPAALSSPLLRGWRTGRFSAHALTWRHLATLSATFSQSPLHPCAWRANLSGKTIGSDSITEAFKFSNSQLLMLLDCGSLQRLLAKALDG